jgi:hypothetical protein
LIFVMLLLGKAGWSGKLCGDLRPSGRLGCRDEQNLSFKNNTLRTLRRVFHR